MNETLQQFCQRILPAVQAGAEGKEIESRHLRADDDWGTHTARMFLLDHEYRAAQPKATPLPITPEMWAMIDQKYEWAVLTNDHDVLFIGGGKPQHDGDIWWFPDLEFASESPLAIDTSGIVPALSLTERPIDDNSSSESEDVSYECKIVNCGTFDTSDPVCAALDEMIIINHPRKRR